MAIIRRCPQVIYGAAVAGRGITRLKKEFGTGLFADQDLFGGNRSDNGRADSP